MEKLTIAQFKKKFKKSLKDMYIKENQFESLCDFHYKLQEDDLGNAIEYLHELNTNKIKRMFYFCFKDGCDKKRGVYKVTFEDKGFYIGRSKYIKSRFKIHERDLRKFFDSGVYEEKHFLRKVFEYLKDNELRTQFEVELLDECYTVDELFNCEQKWLDLYKDDPNCLNVGFIATKPWNEIDETPEQEKERKSKNRTYYKNGKRIWYKIK